MDGGLSRLWSVRVNLLYRLRTLVVLAYSQMVSVTTWVAGRRGGFCSRKREARGARNSAEPDLTDCRALRLEHTQLNQDVRHEGLQFSNVG